MKLSMSLIAHYLEHYHPECHILHDELTVRGVRFLAGSDIPSSLEYVYLGAAGLYYQDPRYQGALLLANGENQMICHCADEAELLNCILSAFDFYAEFEKSLLLAAAEHRPLEDMLQIFRGVLDCTALVFDMEGDLLAGHRGEGMTDWNFPVNSVGRERLSFAGIGEMIETAEGEISHDLGDTPQHLRIRGKDGPDCVALYLCQNGERVGFLMLFAANRAQIPMCLILAPMLAERCASAFEFADSGSLRQSGSSVLAGLLSGTAMAPAVVEKFLADTEIRPNAALMVFQSISVRNYTLHKMLVNDIRLLGAPCIACEHEGRVAILADSSATEEVIRLISSRIAASAMAIGVSMPVQDFGKLPLALKQALFAVQAAPDPGVRHCRDLAFPYLIRTLGEQEMSRFLLHPALDILEKYDRENDARLLQTLQAYVQTGCSQADTAELIHVHLNTLKYRLSRIRELAGVDFKNQEEVFYLWLSLKLREGGA